MPIRPVELAQELIRYPSVTPEDAGVLGHLSSLLKGLGFTTHDLAFGPECERTPNLFARIGQKGPHLCFAGHTDVVPPGDGWRFPPFDASIEEGVLYGRGASDMKGAVAAFIGAVADILADRPLRGSVSFLITGDEEGKALHGTKDVLPWMVENGHIPDFCLVGEPTNPDQLGEMIKIGRRGSLNAIVTVYGVQGHVAYPHRADNPIHRLVDLVNALLGRKLDEGNEWFEPSSLQITNVDVGNHATNVIPPSARVRLNIRYNNCHTGAQLEQWLRETAETHAPGADVDIAISGDAFLTTSNPFIELLSNAVQKVSGHAPRLDTSGGTSDARFITHICPTAEFGLVGATMHKVDEAVPVKDILTLRDIYRVFIESIGL